MPIIGVNIPSSSMMITSESDPVHQSLNTRLLSTASQRAASAALASQPTDDILSHLNLKDDEFSPKSPLQVPHQDDEHRPHSPGSGGRTLLSVQMGDSLDEHMVGPMEEG